MPLIQGHTKTEQAEQQTSVSKFREIRLQVYLKHFLPILVPVGYNITNCQPSGQPGSLYSFCIFVTQFFLSSLTVAHSCKFGGGMWGENVFNSF